MTKRTKRWNIRQLILAAALILAIAPFLARGWVHLSARGQVYPNINAVPKCDVALVLGCAVRPDGSLSVLLADRVRTAVRLYKHGKVKKLLMSGDNRVHDYNEPEKMRSFAMYLGVPSRDIVLDYAGRRTFDSIYRAKHIFGQDRLIVVSQRFHLDRALFLCRHEGVSAYGVPGSWPGRPRDQVRETVACLGAIADIYLLKPRPIMGRKERIDGLASGRWGVRTSASSATRQSSKPANRR